MAFLQPRAGDLHKGAVAAHLLDRGAAGIAHRRAQTADQLVQHDARRPLVGHLPLDPLRDQLVAGGVLLEITVGRAARHRTQAAHAAIGLVGPALVEDHLARAFIRPRNHGADHRAGGTRRNGLGEIARELDATIGNHRNVTGSGRAFHDRGELRHADTRHHARRADRAGPDPHLDRIGARVDQGACRIRRRHVPRDHLDLVRQQLGAFDRLQHTGGMAMRRVHHDDVDLRVHQRLRAFIARIAHSCGGGHAQTAKAVLASGRVQHCLFRVLQRQQPGQLAILVGHQKLFDPPRLHQVDRFLAVRRFGQDREVVPGHHRVHGRAVILGKAHVAIGHDAEDAMRFVDHREPGKAVALCQHPRIAQGLVGAQGDGVVDDAAFKALDPPDLARLLLDPEVLVDHPHAAGLCQGDRHPAFGYRVHRGTQQGDVQRNRLGHLRPCICRRRQHVRGRGNKQDVIEGQGLANLHWGTPWEGSVGASLSHAQRGKERARGTGSHPPAPSGPCHRSSMINASRSSRLRQPRACSSGWAKASSI